MRFSFNKALNLMLKAKFNNRVSHAYLIISDSDLTLSKFALEFIKIIDNNIKFKILGELNNQNSLLISPESKSRRIKIDSIRKIERVFQRKVSKNEKKIIVIEEADRMTINSQNALLKTLEEPPDSSHILLLTSNPENLLKTTISRCIIIRLEGDRDLNKYQEKLLEYLKEYIKNTKFNISDSLNLMGNFIDLLRAEKKNINEINTNILKEEKKKYQKIIEGNYLKTKEEYYKSLSESQYMKFRDELIEVLISWIGDSLRIKTGISKVDFPKHENYIRKFSDNFTVDQLIEKSDKLEIIKTQLKFNIYEPIVFEVGFTDVFS